MLTDNVVLMNIGLVVTGIIAVMTSMKLMRNNYILIGLFFIAVSMAIFAVIFSIKYHNTPFEFLSPLIYMLTYNGLRLLYIKAYRIEPTYNKGSMYDYGDGRKQNWFDVFVFITPLICSFGVPIYLSTLK